VPVVPFAAATTALTLALGAESVGGDVAPLQSGATRPSDPVRT
jgi:hypothetical protein